MKTYNTYQEAKIENPECEIAIVSRADAFTPPKGKFIAVIVNNDNRDGFSFADKSKSGWQNIRDGYYTICNPKDYCMTVEEFLYDGHNFVEGDLVYNSYPKEKLDEIEIDDLLDYNILDCEDHKRFILRAEALEKPNPDDLDSESASESEIVDLSIKSDFIIKPKRTKEEFVKVKNIKTVKFWELSKELDEIGLYYRNAGEYKVIENNKHLLHLYSRHNVYRKVVTELTEIEAFIDKFDELHKKYAVDESFEPGEFGRYMFESGEFKLAE